MATLQNVDFRHRSEPRISANDLAKYMVTPDPGRLGIIRRSRDSATPPRIRYAELKSGLVTFLADIRRPEAALGRLRLTLESRRDTPRSTTFIRQDAELSLAAMDAFENMKNALGGYRFVAPGQRFDLLAIAGVNVSINLDLFAVRTKNGEDQFGGVLLRLTKPDDEETENAASKRREMGLYAATLAHMQARSLAASPGAPHHDLCMSIDVQCGEVHLAGRSAAMRSSRLEAACRFIAAMWDSA